MFEGIIGTIVKTGLGIVDKLIKDPEKAQEMKLDMLKLAQEGEFKELEADLQRERNAIEDRASARQMQMKTEDPTPRWIAIGFMIGFFGILIAMLFGVSVSPDQATLVNVLLGALAGGVVSILNFYFGSSVGSKNKEQAMIKEIDQLRFPTHETTTAPIETPKGRDPIEGTEPRPLPPKPPLSW